MKDAGFYLVLPFLVFLLQFFSNRTAANLAKLCDISDRLMSMIQFSGSFCVCWPNLPLFLLEFPKSRHSFPERMSASSKESVSASVLAPLFIGISTLVSPQGVGIYWFTNTLLTTAQLKLTQNEVAEEFPEYKKIKDSVDAGEGMRYTRNSPFVKNELVAKSVEELEEPAGKVEPKQESRSSRRKKRSKSRTRSS